MIDHGSGPPLVLIPGLPGPWHYVAPAMHALSADFHVMAMSLGRECTIEADVMRIDKALSERHIDRAVVCGISFGGLVALRFAAIHPRRTAALVLASAPGPGATLRAHHRLYTRWPWIFGPLFMLETPYRLRRELHWSQMKALVAAPVSFAKIARRARLIESTDIEADCRRVESPTLVITGEPDIDRVVPVDSTTQYVRAIRGARHVEMKFTGHLGSVTQSAKFAGIVRDFAGDYVRPRTTRGEVA